LSKNLSVPAQTVKKWQKRLTPNLRFHSRLIFATLSSSGCHFKTDGDKKLPLGSFSVSFQALFRSQWFSLVFRFYSVAHPNSCILPEFLICQVLQEQHQHLPRHDFPNHILFDPRAFQGHTDPNYFIQSFIGVRG
jgi:hypothetical protein